MGGIEPQLNPAFLGKAKCVISSSSRFGGNLFLPLLTDLSTIQGKKITLLSNPHQPLHNYTNPSREDGLHSTEGPSKAQRIQVSGCGPLASLEEYPEAILQQCCNQILSHVDGVSYRRVQCYNIDAKIRG